MSFTERARIFPPILVRLLARDGKYGKPLCTRSIAFEARISIHHADALSQATSWDDVQFGTMVEFLRACRCNFDDSLEMRRVFDYLRKNPTLAHIRRSELWDDYYKLMLIRWRRSVGELTNAADYPPPLRALLIRLNPLLKGAV